MAKELYELSKFVTGTVSNMADRDIPDDAASFSKNMDPTSVSGKIKPIKAATEIKDGAGSPASLGKGTAHAFINNGGKRDLVWYDPANNDIEHVTDLYGTKGSITVHSGGDGITSSADEVTMEPNNRELHIGTGSGATDKPKWAGYIPHGQFTGSAPATIQIENAELLSPGNFPTMYSICEDEDYIYGVEYEGQFIYKFKKSDYSLEKISDTRFSETTCIALAGDVSNYGKTYANNHLWVFDKGHSTNGTIYKVDRANLGIVQENQIASGVGGAGVITSMVQSTNQLWIASHKGDGQYLTATVVYRVATPTTTTSITFTDASPWAASAGTGEDSYDGDYFSAAQNSDNTAPTTARFYTVRNSLCLAGATTAEVCWFTRITNASGAAAYMAYHNNSGVNHAYPLGQCAWIIKEAYTTVSEPQDNNTVTNAYPVTFEVGVSNAMTATDLMVDILQQKAANGFIAELYISHYPTGNTDNVKISQYPLITQHSSYNSVFSNTNSAQTNQIDADHAQYVPTEGAVEQGLLTGENTNGSSQAVAGYKLNIFSGASYGAWAIVDGDLSGNTGFKLRSTLELGVATSGTNTEFSSTYTYFYACSFTYDGYQESPLSEYTKDTLNQTKNRSITLKLFNLPGSSSSLEMSQRITHINLYRSETTTANASAPDGYFRLVKSQKLDSSFAAKSDSWCNYKEIVILDSHIDGPSYEGLSGLPETIDRTLPNYALSTQLNNELIIGKCYHPDIENTENYLFKSLPYKYDSFDWTSDLLRLPVVPTALAAFQGKVYAFSENNTYRINTQGMYIEDILEGVGCLGKDAVVVTDYGMCFADINNIYLHDGRQASPIGTSILVEEASGDAYGGYGWLNKTTKQPLILFEGKKKSFVIMFQKTDNSSNMYFGWSYNVPRRRWDLWSNVEYHGGITGKNGEMLVNNGSGLYHMQGATGDNNWEFHTKNITMGMSTQEKMFYKINTVGSSGCEITYKVDDGNYVTQVEGNTMNIAAADKKKKAIKIKVSGTNNEEIDAIGLVYRSLKIK